MGVNSGGHLGSRVVNPGVNEGAARCCVRCPGLPRMTIDENLVEITPSWHLPVQFWRSSGEAYAKFGRARPQFGQPWPAFHRFNRIGPMFGQSWAGVDQSVGTSTDVGPIAENPAAKPDGQLRQPSLATTSTGQQYGNTRSGLATPNNCRRSWPPNMAVGVRGKT